MVAKRIREEDFPGPAAKKAGNLQDQSEGEPAHLQDGAEDELPDVIYEAYQNAHLPEGWLETPSMGEEIGNIFIPMKVPLSRGWNRIIRAPHLQFTPEMALQMAGDKLAATTPQGASPPRIGLVIDLTSSSRYYETSEFSQHGVSHIKVECKGRGESPRPEDVNAFFWQVISFRNEYPGQKILVHCTHGFNRTGYVIACTLLRLYPNVLLGSIIKDFARLRPPGIYKDAYIDDLFKYHHEIRPEDIPPPALPPWKDEADGDEADGGAEPPGAADQPPIQHDDVFGEEIVEAQANLVRQCACEGAFPRDEYAQSQQRYPGSQPVSLARSNLGLLTEHRYYVTHKADGTRFMVYLSNQGTFLIDRAFTMRRVQMRWPRTQLDPHGRAVAFPLGQAPQHKNTLLDGEMVVDVDPQTGVRTRRFLIYDLVMLNGQSVVDLPFKNRFELIEKEVVAPRGRERAALAAAPPGGAFRYQYGEEPFGVRRKLFFPLKAAKHLLKDFIPKLSHESDGVILQDYEAPYIPGTCRDLLKWKFAHLNSVDFLLEKRGEAMVLYLLHPTGQGSAMVKPLAGAQVEFPEGEDPRALVGQIIECSYKKESGAWVYMRRRTDKITPNAIRTYENVLKSIQDDITEDNLLGALNHAFNHAEAYRKDRERN